MMKYYTSCRSITLRTSAITPLEHHERCLLKTLKLFTIVYRILATGRWLESSIPLRRSVARRARNICEPLCRIQEARRQAGVRASKYLLELLHSSAEDLIAALFPATTPNWRSLNAKRSTLCEEAGRYRERSLACESELIAELGNAKVETAELKTSLDAGTARAHRSEMELARLKATYAVES